MLKLILLLCFFGMGMLSNANTSDTLKEEKATWIQLMNQDELSDDIMETYWDQAALFKDDVLYQGSHHILNQLRDLKGLTGRIDSFVTIQVFPQRDNRAFELGYYTTDGPDLYYVIGWRLEDRWIRELEVFYTKMDFDEKAEALESYRKKWEALSNDHKPEELIRQLCSEEGYYFNGGRIFQGMEIAKAYAYMSGPSWKIQLTGLKEIQVQPNLIYDIGSFTSSGTGLYCLIWRKQQGDWKIILDFNF